MRLWYCDFLMPNTMRQFLVLLGHYKNLIKRLIFSEIVCVSVKNVRIKYEITLPVNTQPLPELEVSFLA